MDINLTKEQKEQIHKYIPIFKKYQESSQASEDRKDREEKTAFYQSLSKDKLLSMDEAQVQTVVSNLWATQFWKNQQYILDKILTENGLDALRSEFAELICGENPIGAYRKDAIDIIENLGIDQLTIRPGVRLWIGRLRCW